MKQCYPIITSNATPEEVCEALNACEQITRKQGYEGDFERYIQVLKTMMGSDCTERFESLHGELTIENEARDEADQWDDEAINREALNQWTGEFFNDVDNCFS